MAAYWRDDPQFRTKLQGAVQEGVTAFLLVTASAMREQLSKRGTGRTYRIGKGKRNGRNARAQGLHRASAPGKPPAANTGTLRRSWQIGRANATGPVSQSSGGGSPLASVLPRNIAGVQYGYRYGSPLHYARIDRGYGRVKPRPYIVPTINAISDLFEPTVANAMRRNFR